MLTADIPQPLGWAPLAHRQDFPMHPRSPVRMLFLAAVALMLPLSGCAAVTEPADVPEPRAAVSRDEANERESARAEPADAAVTAPKDAADSTNGDAAAGTADAASARASLRDRLLDAHELPILDETSWSEARTSNREPSALAGTCHHFEMLTIGAGRVAYREFAAADGGAARTTQLVAQFADAKTAWRAFEVLKSWREDCEEELTKYDHSQVGELTRVDAGGSDALRYLVRYGPAGDDASVEYLDAQGLALVGTRVAVLRMAIVGPPRHADRIAASMDSAVRTAVAKLP